MSEVSLPFSVREGGRLVLGLVGWLVSGVIGGGGLRFGHGGVSRAISSWTSMVQFSEHGRRLEASFSLCVDRFLD